MKLLSINPEKAEWIKAQRDLNAEIAARNIQLACDLYTTGLIHRLVRHRRSNAWVSRSYTTDLVGELQLETGSKIEYAQSSVSVAGGFLVASQLVYYPSANSLQHRGIKVISDGGPMPSQALDQHSYNDLPARLNRMLAQEVETLANKSA